MKNTARNTVLIQELVDFLERADCPEAGYRLLESEPMSRHTTFGVGGPAELFASASPEAAVLIRDFCRERELPFLVIGKGSNLLVPDEGLKGMVLTLSSGEEPSIAVRENTLSVSAGETLSAAALAAEKHALTGLEFAGGIPGSVGGGVVMNAGAYGGELKDVLSSARVLTETGERKTVGPGELSLSYRHSNVTENGWIVISAELTLMPGEKETIRTTMRELSERRREKQPLEFHSAGSTFKRPEGHFAGKLIEEAGLKGFSIGGAQVSEKHCGFVINRGNATASDILGVIREVRRRVFETSGIMLEPEVKILCDL